MPFPLAAAGRVVESVQRHPLRNGIQDLLSNGQGGTTPPHPHLDFRLAWRRAPMIGITFWLSTDAIATCAGERPTVARYFGDQYAIDMSFAHVQTRKSLDRLGKRTRRS